jgi:hypothetical protein
MANEFDPYREALVMEAITIWPEEFDDLTTAQRQHIEQALHSEPASASDLAYVRQHTGFQRQITVTAEDVERLSQSA